MSKAHNLNYTTVKYLFAAGVRVRLTQADNFRNKGGFTLKYIKQFLTILLIAFAGEILNTALPFPIPASIYGIVILFLCLEFRIIPLHAIRETSIFLIEIMPLLFIPAAVGILDSWNIIKTQWLPYVIITLATTIIVMVVAGHVTQAVIRFGKEKKHD